MQFTKALLSCALFASAAVAQAKNNAAAIKADISDLSTLLAQLSGDSAQFTDFVTGIPFALQVQIDAVNIDKVLLRATADAKASTKLNDNDSLAIGLQLVGTSNTVADSLTKIKKKVVAFGDLKPLVLYTLYALKADTVAFSTALTAKLAAFEQLLAPAIVANIVQNFDSAIKTYGG